MKTETTKIKLLIVLIVFLVAGEAGAIRALYKQLHDETPIPIHVLAKSIESCYKQGKNYQSYMYTTFNNQGDIVGRAVTRTRCVP